MLRTFVILLVISGAALLRGRAFASGPVAAMQLVPAQAHAVIVIPHLKLLSDQITQCLQGMDRANLLLGVPAAGSCESHHRFQLRCE